MDLKALSAWSLAASILIVAMPGTTRAETVEPGAKVVDAKAPPPETAAAPSPADPSAAGSPMRRGEEVRPNLQHISAPPPPKAEDELLPMFPAKAPERRGALRTLYHLRCWQQGKLLFAETDMPEASAQDFLARSALRGGGKPPERLAAGQMQALEYAGAFCLLKRR